MALFGTLPVVSEDTERLMSEIVARHDAEAMVEHLQESLAAVEMMLEDAGWDRIGGSGEEFSGRGRDRARLVCRLMSIANAMIKRGLAVRHAYIWGSGVSISGRDATDGTGQDVNAVIQAFLDRNAATFTGAQAREELERALGTDGEIFLALVTSDPNVGTVDVRIIPPEEIADIVTNPEDKAQPWLYLREFTTRRMNDFGAFADQVERIAYPAVGYRRRGGWPATVTVGGAVYRVDATTSVRQSSVNRPSRSLRGVGDAFAALPWARGYKEFLEQWATLMAALSQFALSQSTPPGKAQAAALAVQRTVASQDNLGGYGATYTAPQGYRLDAVSTAGARFDADSGRPLAAMCAAALGIPVTMLLADPGITGARAMGETLDQPTELEMSGRRRFWGDEHRVVINYVIDEAVIAHQLQGRIVVDGDRLVVLLPEESDRTIDLSWPDYASTPVDVLVKAIATADATEKIAPLTTSRLLHEALGVDNVDEALDLLTDDKGRWIGPSANAGQVAVDAFNRGEDPAGALA